MRGAIDPQQKRYQTMAKKAKTVADVATEAAGVTTEAPKTPERRTRTVASTTVPPVGTRQTTRGDTEPDKGEEDVVSQKPSQQSAAQPNGEVRWPEIKVRKAQGGDPITVEQAKEILGWQEETEGEAFGEEYALIDLDGKKVRLRNNVNNRPLYQGITDNLKYEILRKHWKFNGEPIIVGKMGHVLNGQHTLVGLVLADQERVGEDAEHWSKFWQEACTIEKLIVYGVDESDSVVNTMDTCKPRTLADVIYRSVYFATLRSGERKLIARATDYCIRLLWYRTGVANDAFAPRKTHSEALDFLDRHPRILEVVRELFDLDADKGITRYLSVGYSSALAYMMAASNTSGEVYRGGERREQKIDFGQWDKALEFWKLLSGTDPQFRAVRYAVGALTDPESGAIGNISEKIAVLCLAWILFVQGKKIENDDVALRYNIDEDTGVKSLIDVPDFGGIDLGDTRLLPRPKKGKKNAEDEEGEAAGEAAAEEEDEVQAADEDAEAVAEAEDAALDVAAEEVATEEEEAKPVRSGRSRK